MAVIRRVEDHEVELARNLHNRFTAQDRSMATVRSWCEAVPNLFLFAVDGSDPIGVCTGRPHGRQEVSLAGIGIEPNRRGEGIGTRLVEQFEKHARAAGVDRVSVASAGGRVDNFYIENGFDPEKILVVNPTGGPETYDDTGFDTEWDRDEDGSQMCYVDVTGYDPALLKTVRDRFDGDDSMYIMAKQLSDQ